MSQVTWTMLLFFISLKICFFIKLYSYLCNVDTTRTYPSVKPGCTSSLQMWRCVQTYVQICKYQDASKLCNFSSAPSRKRGWVCKRKFCLASKINWPSTLFLLRTFSSFSFSVFLLHWTNIVLLFPFFFSSVVIIYFSSPSQIYLALSSPLFTKGKLFLPFSQSLPNLSNNKKNCVIWMYT